MKYYVKSNGKTYGPVEEKKIARKIASGFFSRECLLSTDQTTWVGRAMAPQVLAEVAMLEEENAAPRKKRIRIPIWLIVLIIVLLLVAAVVTVLVVDSMCMDGKLTSWLYN